MGCVTQVLIRFFIIHDSHKIEVLFTPMTLYSFPSVSGVNTNPGPGTYDYEHTRSIGDSNSLKYSIRSRCEVGNKSLTNAGYLKLPSSLSHIKFSIGRKIPERSFASTVGPSYFPDSSECFRKGAKILVRYNPVKDNNYPGPGHYSPTTPKSTVVPTQGSRLDTFLGYIPDSPGPAAYDVPRDIGNDVPKYSIRPKDLYEPKEEPNPGYTFNNLPVFGKDARKASFTKASRSVDYSTFTPGPGTYKLDDAKSHGSLGLSIHEKILPSSLVGKVENDQYYDTRSFPEIKKRSILARCGRTCNDPTSTVPGPTYMPNSTLDIRPISIHNKYDLKSNMQTPGPSDYDPYAYQGSSQKGFTVKGPSERDDWSRCDRSLPGPGQYKIHLEPKSPKWIIGSRSVSNSNSKSVSQD